ncbi:MAG: Re/Si-specific NAD(P)(+) transhydrogenase subunit alpha [Burkholderiaceae bacterium]|nr:MAG: Re/Si-specific NAD(P)(+) transhydrogenase subunit alpha [Burkholderiaceae bacterium]
MQIGIPKETFVGEARVAGSPETVKKFIKLGVDVYVAENAGNSAYFSDMEFKASGAKICSQTEAFQKELVLKVRTPQKAELNELKSGTTMVGMLEPHNKEYLAEIAKRGITAFALESAPRTTRAQTLDVLSSQANIGGYKAVLVGASEYPKLFPMLMTAAGSTKAAKVIVLGAGVAGLQAIATAKRLGAVVEASDVRPSVKEQIESLGAKFIDVPLETEEERAAAEGEGGYAKAMPASWLKRQSERVAEKIAKADMVISTALIPGKKAPLLITNDMVQSMKPGSVIVDMAVEQGGNCEGSEIDTIKEFNGVKVIGFTNLPAKVSSDSSALYSRNIYDFARLIISEEKTLIIPEDDDIVQATLVIKEGQLWKP